MDCKNSGSPGAEVLSIYSYIQFHLIGILFQIEDLINAANGELKGVTFINSPQKKLNVRLYVSSLNIFFHVKNVLLQVNKDLLSALDFQLTLFETYLGVVRMSKDSIQTMFDGSKGIRYYPR